MFPKKESFGWLARVGVITLLYAAWMLLFRLIVLSVITYLIMPSDPLPPASAMAPSPFEEISETFGANELPLIGFASLLFVAFFRWLNPLTRTTTSDIISVPRLRTGFFPGFAHGSVFALGIVVAFILSGLYRYLGFYIQFEEAPLALPGVFVRVLAIASLAYCEEFIFRGKIMGLITAGLIEGKEVPGWRYRMELAGAALTGVIYCAVKAVQFDVGIMHLLSLFLISLALALRTFAERDFALGAGFWAAILIIFHPLFSLPVLGNDYSGVFLFRYQMPESEAATQGGVSRLLTGGAGGPLSSLAFQLLVLFDVVRSMRRRKKTLLPSSSEG